MCVHQDEQHIERVCADMHAHKPPHSLCLSLSSLSLTKGQWCVKLRCAACDSINEWIALSIECVLAYVCVCLEYGGINSPFDPLLQITQYYGWLCIHMCVCVCVCVRDRERDRVLANPSHSAASWCLIYHSTKKGSWQRGGRCEENDGDQGRKVELTEMKWGSVRQI